MNSKSTLFAYVILRLFFLFRLIVFFSSSLIGTFGYVNFLVGNYFSLSDLPAIILKRRSKSNHLFNIPVLLFHYEINSARDGGAVGLGGRRYGHGCSHSF